MTEIDNSINRTHTLYGQIKSLENNNNNYTCQGCGGINLTDQINFISCNDCHSRLLKETDRDDDFLKITILTRNHEEYNLKIRNSLILPFLNNNNICTSNNNDPIIVKDDLNSMISKIIQFTFSEATAIIDDLIIIPGDESFNERMLTGISYLNIYNNNSLFLFR
jgi:hypothetical protein